MIESTQIRWFSRCSGGGRWSGRALTQHRPRVSKLGLKGPSDYHSNEIAVEATKWEGQRAELKGYSHRESTQGENWTTAVIPERQFTANKKELLNLSQGDSEEGSY